MQLGAAHQPHQQVQLTVLASDSGFAAIEHLKTPSLSLLFPL
jgi:hypothetical protein